jgi:type IV fimbrial biogenesis protein FimT
MKRKLSGFTLLEFMFAIALLAVLVGLGVPGLTDFVRSSRMSSAANDIISDFALARSEAVKRGVPVTLCKSQDGAVCDEDDEDPFNHWIIFVDDADPGVVAATDGNGEVDEDEPILRERELPDTLTVTTPADQIRAIFLASGFPVPGAANITRFVLCDSRGEATGTGGDSAARAVEVLPTGRASVFRDAATITAYGGCP